MLDDIPMGGFKATGMGPGTDPADAVNKSQLDAVASAVTPKYAVKSASYTALDADVGTTFRFTAAATLSINTTSTLRDNWRVVVWNQSIGTVIIDPDGTDTINGALTAVLQPGQVAEIFKSGTTTFQAQIIGDPLSTPDFVRGLVLSNNVGNPNTHINIAAGSAKLGRLIVSNLATMTKRINGTWAVGTGNGGLDTGSPTAGGTYYVYSLRKQSDGSFDAVMSLSASGPTTTLLSGYDVVQLLGEIMLDASSFIRPFIQTWNDFMWDAVQSSLGNDLSTGSVRAKALLTCTLPTGRRVKGLFSVIASTTSGDSGQGVTIADGANINAEKSVSNYVSANLKSISQTVEQYTNTSGQVSVAVSSASSPNPTTIKTLGWTDYQIPRVG
jgi:hypothetical protein